MHQSIILMTIASSHQLYHLKKDCHVATARHMVRILLKAHKVVPKAYRSSHRNLDMTRMVLYLALMVHVLSMSQLLLFLRKLSTRFKKSDSIMTVYERVHTKLYSQNLYATILKRQTSFLRHNFRDIAQSKYFRFRGSVTKQAILNISRFFSKRNSTISIT